MALWRVPWAVNGEGVEHSATLARHANFATGADQTGVSGPTSLVVSAGSTPGGFVNVGPGSGVITYAQGRPGMNNWGYTSYQRQSVPVENDAQAQVAIEPTTSAGSRRDLVCIEINDPEAEGTADTVDYSTHEFVRFHVVQGVGEGVQHPHQLPVLDRPLLPLARINIPASTATITDEMITDVRHMAYIKSQSVPLMGRVSTVGSNIDIGPGETSWQTLYSFTDIAVPTWTTRWRVSMGLGPLYGVGGTARGYFRALMTGQNSSVATPASAFVVGDGGRYEPRTAGSTIVSWRTAGMTMRIDLQVRRWDTNSGPGTIRLTRGDDYAVMAEGWITHEEHPRFDTEAGG